MTVTTTRHPRGIRTTYNRTNFRSRLEARWAAFFDIVGWRWTYEPVDTEGYIPEFLIHGPASFYAEVGPCEYLSEFSEKADKAITAAKDLGRPVVVLGLDPLFPQGSSDFHAASGGYFTDDGHGSGTSVGRWATCAKCGATGLYHEYGAWTLRPCGDYDGDHYLGELSSGVLFERWAEAGNKVQWRR